MATSWYSASVTALPANPPSHALYGAECSVGATALSCGVMSGYPGLMICCPQLVPTGSQSSCGFASSCVVTGMHASGGGGGGGGGASGGGGGGASGSGAASGVP